MTTDAERFARLLTACKLHEAEMMANPMPFLERAAGDYCRLAEAVQEAIMVMSGVDNLDIAQELCPDVPPGIVETSVARLNKASAILHAALEPQP